MTNTRIKVGSIQHSVLGHVTYGNMLLDYFSKSATCEMSRVWTSDNRELHARILIRMLCYYGASKGIIRDLNLDFARLRRDLGYAYLGRRLALNMIQSYRPDALHFNTQTPALLAADLMRRIPTAVSLDMTAVQVARENKNVRANWTYKPNFALDKNVFKTAKKLFPWSKWAAKSVIGEYNISPDKVMVVSPGVDFRHFPDPYRPVREVGEKIKLLFVGSDFRRKGGYDLLDVFNHRLFSKCELHVVTDEILGVDNADVHVYRGVKAYSEEWHRLYKTSDLFVLPTHSEAFGLVFVEAIASGLPVVATNINAIPEIVPPGEAGLLITPGDRQALGDAIEELCGNAEKRRNMSVAARLHAEANFDVEVNLRMMELAFCEIVAPEPTRANGQ